MKRYGRRNVFAYVIFGLIAIGILSSLIRSFSAWIIPVLVFGIVFLLYRFPPPAWRRLADRLRARSDFSAWGGKSAGGKRTKRAKFKVIRGSKPDDDIPKYH
jgi:hypothetical protein